MRIAMIVFALLVSMPGGASGQEWIEYSSRQDGFTINFPGTPQITETTWQSQLNYRLPRLAGPSVAAIAGASGGASAT